ncbi:MAG: bifunctional hydroxymethylpyrimidine kinase/phosphomethylpyrimidine kinase [Pyrinomonadaceae bacterium]
MQNVNQPSVVLTIAGLDPSGGAGIIADIKTFAAHGCYGAAAVSSITFQNTTGVFGQHPLTAEVLRRQVMAIVEDLNVVAVKTGLLPTAESVMEVSRLVQDSIIPAPIVDPVMQSTSGNRLIEDRMIEALIDYLLPVAQLITPNIYEAEKLTGIAVNDLQTMQQAAKRLCEMGACAVLIKGGHLPGSATDLFFEHDTAHFLTGERIHLSTETHGSGCTLSAAIVAGLAQGLPLIEAVTIAKKFVTNAIRHALAVGHGSRPVDIAMPD